MVVAVQQVEIDLLMKMEAAIVLSVSLMRRDGISMKMSA